MSYQDECQEVLQRIATENSGVRGLPYFLSTVDRWHAGFSHEAPGEAVQSKSTKTSTTPQVVVLGNGIPEQLIYACGVAPYHVQGGSHASCRWSDEVMPRDADPVSRSILGYALQIAKRQDISSLFVVPIANDNMRKIAYFLKHEGHEVLPVDVPPVWASVSDQYAWERSIQTLVQGVQRHTGRRATTLRIRKTDKLVTTAKTAMVEFERTCVACDGQLSGEAMLLVLNSYYQTANLAEWTAALKNLTAEIAGRHQTAPTTVAPAPHVLVIGSPIVFPQYKVPAHIQDAGLRLAAAVDATSTARYAWLTPQERRGGAARLTNAIARKHYTVDSSSAHVVNSALEQYVEHLLSSRQVDGVVCHILKGQIEYDFELARLESLFESRDIPVFRLETDYQYQDVEQLRIRLEAFSEMLAQRAFVARQANAAFACA